MKNRKYIYVPILALCVLFFGIWLKGCLNVDSCLDSGGRWNYEKNICEH